MKKKLTGCVSHGSASWKIIVAILIVLIAAIAFAEQTEINKPAIPRYNIKGGKPVDRHSIERLMDDSLEPAEVRMHPNGKRIMEVNGRFSIDKSEPVEEAAVDFIDKHRNAFGLKKPKGELRVLKKYQDEFRKKFKDRSLISFEQLFNGVPIWNKRLGVTIDEGEITYIGGDYSLTPDGLDTNPALTPDEAIKKVKEDLNQRAGGEAILQKTFKPTAELIIYSDDDYSFELAYDVKVSASKPSGSWNYFVDAKDGHIIVRRSGRKRDSINGRGGIVDRKLDKHPIFFHALNSFSCFPRQAVII